MAGRLEASALAEVALADGAPPAGGAGAPGFASAFFFGSNPPARFRRTLTPSPPRAGASRRVTINRPCSTRPSASGGLSRLLRGRLRGRRHEFVTQGCARRAAGAAQIRPGTVVSWSRTQGLLYRRKSPVSSTMPSARGMHRYQEHKIRRTVQHGSPQPPHPSKTTSCKAWTPKLNTTTERPAEGVQHTNPSQRHTKHPRRGSCAARHRRITCAQSPHPWPRPAAET